MRSLQQAKWVLVLLGVALALAIGLMAHIVLQWPYERGFDAQGHLEYIQHFQETRRVPLAYEGWELYQPPLYYWVHHFIPTIKGVQWAGFGWTMIYLVALSVYLGYLRYPTWKKWWGVVLGAGTGVTMYMTATLGNEWFNAVMTTITMVIYLTWFRGKESVEKGLGLGCLLGLTILAKATGLLVPISIFIDQIWLHRKRLNKLPVKVWLAGILTVLAVGGWFYLRNWILLGNPVKSSIDYPAYAIQQEPGYRDMKFFYDLSGLFKLDLYRAHWYSFIPGTLFSFFYDGHNIVIPVQETSLAGKLLILASIPLVMLGLVGFFWGITGWRQNTQRIWWIYGMLLIAGYVAYNLKLPFYSTVKGSFIASILPAYVYWVLQGSEHLKIDTRKVWIGVYMLAYILLLTKNFWILPGWY